jgi:hypothetical protein
VGTDQSGLTCHDLYMNTAATMCRPGYELHPLIHLCLDGCACPLAENSSVCSYH